MKKPSELSALLPTLFADKPLGKRLRESVIWRVWDRSVGQQIASKARPVAFREGTLTVVVSSSPWMQQLGFLKQQMMDALNSALGETMITTIYLKAGITAPTLPPRASHRPTRCLTPQEETRIAQEATAIPDEELRAAFIRCRAAWLRTTPENPEFRRQNS